MNADYSADGTQICKFYSGKSRPTTFKSISAIESRQCHRNNKSTLL